MELTLLLRLLISEAGRFPRTVLGEQYLGKVGSYVYLVSHESGIRGVQDRWRDEAVDFQVINPPRRRLLLPEGISARWRCSY